jgi:transposase
MNSTPVPAKTARKRYDKTFRRHSVELWQSSNKTGVEMAAELGIKPNRLYSWREQLRPGLTLPVVPANPEALAAENAALRQELAHLRQQRDILKKTLGILSEAPHNATPGLRS